MPIIYQDDFLSIEVGIDMRNPTEELEISSEHAVRDLSNSIKIKVNSSGAHFIQFVTRIVPDLYEFKQKGIAQWDSEIASYEPHYMKVHHIPRWKVDTADDNSCFYDSAGVHKRTAEYTAIYDYPGGLYEALEERVIFCTFINIGDNITHKIQWSKQYDIDNNEFYTVQVQRCEFLPDWAIKTITEDAWHTNGKTFQLPESLMRRYNSSLPEEDLLSQAREDFLQPPVNWITMVTMSALFTGQLEKQATDHLTTQRPRSPL